MTRQFPTTRASLLQRIRDPRDHEAWSDFADIYQPVVYRIARSRGLQPADADELAQRVLIAVSERIDGWQPDRERGRFRTWLSTIARNIAVDMLRRAIHRQTAESQGSAGVETLAQPIDESHLELEYRRQVFRWAARVVRREFTEKTWRAFWLTSVDQVSAGAAAEELGQTIGSIYTARSRVMRRLQQVAKQFSTGGATIDDGHTQPSASTDPGGNSPIE